MASTSSSLRMLDRPLMSSRRATSIRWDLEALASTPSAVSAGRRLAPRAACSSLGPFCFLGSQWSPTFSYECLSEANAVRWARSPSPYVSTAESCVSLQISWACLSLRLMVLGSSSRAGIAFHLRVRRLQRGSTVVARSPPGRGTSADRWVEVRRQRHRFRYPGQARFIRRRPGKAYGGPATESAWVGPRRNEGAQ